MRTPTSPPGRFVSSERGFSLFEIMVVIVLFALAAAVVLPSFSGGFKGLELETTARDMVTRMKQARSEAVAQQTVFRILLKPGTDGSAYALADAYGEEIESYPLPKGIVFEIPEELESDRVSFYPNGRSSGGELSMKNEPGRQLRIVVDPVTGFARVVLPGREE